MRSISLLPPEARTLRSTVIPNNVLILLVVVVVVLAGSGYYVSHLSGQVSSQRSTAVASSVLLVPLDHKTNKLSIEAAEKVGVNANELRKTVIEVSKGRPDWARILEEIYGATGGSTISTMSLETPGTSAVSAEGTTQSSSSFDVSITGTAPTQGEMVAFVRRLRTLPSVSSASLLSSTHTQEGKGVQSSVSFSIGADLKALSAPAYLAKAVGTTAAAGGTP